MKDRDAIDWLDMSCRSLRSGFPEVSEVADLVAERLSALLLDRLSPATCGQLLSLLPRTSHRNARSLRLSAVAAPDPSIGFPDFVERTHHLVGLTDLLDSPEYEDSQEEYGRLCQRIAEAYLWNVLQEVPAELKTRMIEELPLELRSRMNLYSASPRESKVA